jgi:RES domain-containing protein
VYRIGYRGAVGLHDLYFGALRDAGRWHTPRAGARTAVVYTAGSRALAQLEKRVHCNGIEPADMALLRLDLADGAKLVSAEDLGLRDDWRNDEAHTQAVGNDWLLARKSLGLWVPSYVEKRERNLLLNPEQTQYATHVTVVVEDRDFHFDPRMF